MNVAFKQQAISKMFMVHTAHRLNADLLYALAYRLSIESSLMSVAGKVLAYSPGPHIWHLWPVTAAAKTASKTDTWTDHS